MSSCNLAYNHITYICIIDNVDDKMPSYKEMIDLLSNVEKSYVDVPETLCSQFRELYPQIPIGRPDRFYDTVK